MASASPNDSNITEGEIIEDNYKNDNMETTTSDDAVNRLLQRRKTDMMYELRSIEHSHRPVTGQDHRENLHQFMKKHLTDPTHSKGNIPSNVDDVAEHRPQSVVVEVQGIVEQRPVSSVLQSAAFRHRLENIIRGSLQSSRRSMPSSSRTLRERMPTVTSTPVAHNNRGDVINDDVEASIPVARTISNAETNHSIPSPSPRRSLHSTQSPTQNEEDNNNHDGVESHAGISWNDISRVHREEIVQELSELLHNRLVSSTLEGEFRATLELLVENRVDTNGPAVQEFVQSLPGRGIPRNDFSHLGIGPLNDLDNSDNISIASVSAHSVPYTQTNTYLGREIQSLKTQLKEMMNMVKLTHELQMDIQRSIRQEVSAALSQYSGDGANSTTCPGASNSQPVRDNHCLICLDRYSDSVLYQCGHMCVCYICGKDLILRKHCCPVCRAPIKDVIRAYKTNFD